MSVVCDSSAGSSFIGIYYSQSLSRLYQDFLCFSIIYMCIRSLLPNSFLTFNLWMNGIRSVVGKCTCLSFKTIQMSSHLISNTSISNSSLGEHFLMIDHLLTWINGCSWLIGLDPKKCKILYQPKTTLSSPYWRRDVPKRIHSS